MCALGTCGLVWTSAHQYCLSRWKNISPDFVLIPFSGDVLEIPPSAGSSASNGDGRRSSAGGPIPTSWMCQQEQPKLQPGEEIALTGDEVPPSSSVSSTSRMSKVVPAALAVTADALEVEEEDEEESTSSSSSSGDLLSSAKWPSVVINRPAMTQSRMQVSESKTYCLLTSCIPGKAFSTGSFPI